MAKQILYKVLNKDNQAKDGGSFDYTPYLPKNGKPGKWTPVINDVVECYIGYHVTPYWNMFLSSETDCIYEVEVKGIVNKTEVGVINKYVGSSIRLIKQIHPMFKDKTNTGNSNTGNSNTGNCNTGNSNTGHWNTGNCNTGNYNTGNSNTGYSNTGYSNTGNRNAGNSNTGNYNTGNYNTGKSNTGNYNTGNWNTGNSNTGNCNTGNSNTGNCNTGNCNTGNRNTGHWNTGHWNTGYFNVDTPSVVIFGKETTLKREQILFPQFLYFDLVDGKTYQQCFIDSFNQCGVDEVKQLLELPNFDYGIFEQISGITKKMIQDKIKKKK